MASNRIVNSKIPHQYVTIVQPDGKLAEKPVRLESLLREIDQSTSFVELVSGGQKPLVKIRDKKDVIEQERSLKKKRAASRVVEKELQVSWTISDGDLDHKMSQARTYFRKGYRVSFHFSAKQGQLSPPPSDCQGIVDRVVETLADVASVHNAANSGKGATARTVTHFHPRQSLLGSE